MRNSFRILLSLILIALIAVFIVIIALGIFNVYTLILLIVIFLIVIFGGLFILISERGGIPADRIRRETKVKLRSLRDSILTRTRLSNQSIDTITCYSCRDIFIEKENVCDKCGAPKPHCIVCGLDLTPETDPSDEVIITSCCSVYVHTEHILEWLQIKEICPNCKQKITKEDLILSNNFNV